MVSECPSEMGSLIGLKPPGPLVLDTASNWKAWFQCSMCLYVAGQEAHTVFAKFRFDYDQHDQIEPIITAFKVHCLIAIEFDNHAL